LPELTTTPRAVARGKRDREIFTGAPQTRFVVKTPTAVDGLSVANRARSSLDGSPLMPHATLAARKPAGSGTAIATVSFFNTALFGKKVLFVKSVRLLDSN
jgi:hypothetical protein